MDEADNPFSDASAIDRASSPGSTNDSSTTRSWTSFGSDVNMRWARTIAPRTPLHIRRARKRSQSVDEAYFSNKTLYKQDEANDQNINEDPAGEHDEPAAPVRSNFLVDSGTGSSPSNGHQRLKPKPSNVLNLGHLKEVLARKSYARRPYEAIPEELLISPNLRLRERNTWSHATNTPKSQDRYTESRKSLTAQSAIETEPVRIFEVPREQRQLVKDLLRTSTRSDLPLPNFVILTDASYAEIDATARQSATDDSATKVSDHHSCRPTFTRGLLTMLSYNSHAQNGLLAYGKQPSGSDVRFFELPNWSQPQMFHGVSLLVPDWEQSCVLLKNLAAQEPPLLRCLTRSAMKGEQIPATNFLLDQHLPKPLCREAIWVLQMEAQRIAAIYAGKPLPFELPKTDRVHVYNGWLILLEGLLHTGYGADEAPDSHIRSQCNLSSEDSEATNVPDHEEARQLVQASFENEIHKRLQ